MPRLDDLRLAPQGLTYLASVARVVGEQARADAERQGNVSVRDALCVAAVWSPFPQFDYYWAGMVISGNFSSPAS
jgi:hypothetical protein